MAELYTHIHTNTDTYSGKAVLAANIYMQLSHLSFYFADR